jgi:NIMA (never in mitosis gene a)-related kinase 1/4/5
LEEQKNLLCIVMEYADGGDLQGLMKKKSSKGHKFNENFIWQVAFDLLSGLKVLHSSKIIHRDIKPANIFFVDGVAKLGDLNVSKVMEGKFAKTQTGTPYYTSPEIWNNKAYDYRCDIWSLGCVLYELCALRPPFMAKDFPGLSRKVTAGYYDPISSLYSKKLQSMIKKCLTVEQTKRPTAE